MTDDAQKKLRLEVAQQKNVAKTLYTSVKEKEVEITRVRGEMKTLSSEFSKNASQAKQDAALATGYQKRVEVLMAQNEEVERARAELETSNIHFQQQLEEACVSL